MSTALPAKIALEAVTVADLAARYEEAHWPAQRIPAIISGHPQVARFI